LPPAVGTATQDLRATVEAKLHEIVEAAEARAHEIEDRALEQALEIEQDSERKARGRFQSSSDRGAEMVAAIDAFELEVVESLRKLRERSAALASELGFETPVAPAPEQAEALEPAGEAIQVETPEPEAPEPEAPEPESLEVEAPEAEAEAEPEAEPDDAREDVRRQILDLFMAGKPRVEAERLLGRIEEGSRYIDLLDEVYEGRTETQQGSSRRRRGGRRRRRPGSP
jgi:hypothetical protein